MNVKNNLFYYATKELSQDAFICWLCSYALKDADKSEPKLNECAKDLICEFMKLGLGNEVNSDSIILEKVERQVGNIDVLLTARYQEKEYKIIVEDKTHTSEHDDQLKRYVNNTIKADCEVIGIYFKTGFQSNYEEVKKAGYKVFGRKNIIEFLNRYDVKNAIYISYKEYWNGFESFTQSYKDLSVSEWSDWQQVNGFYDWMVEEIRKTGYWADYGYVSNPSGGFWGLWYGPNDCHIVYDKSEMEFYLQIETKWNNDTSKYDMRICTKLGIVSGENADEDARYLREILFGKQKTYGFERPKYTRFGAHMTIGEYQFESENMNCNVLNTVVFDAAKAYEELKGAIKAE